MKLYFTIAFSLFSFYFISAQHVGIGTTEPTTNLHLKSNKQTITAIFDDFEDNMMNPPYNGASEMWQISSGAAQSGILSLQAPLIITGNVSIYYPINLDGGKKLIISGYKQHPNLAGNSIGISLTKNGSIVNSQILSNSSTNSNWEYFEVSVLVPAAIDQVQFFFNTNNNYNALPFYLDDFKIQYDDGYSIRVEDGHQSNGALLMSDELGNATWTSDFSQFQLDSSSTNELQTLNLQGNALSISDGNSVDLNSIDNQTLSLQANTLTISNGNSLNLDLIDNQTLAYNEGQLNISQGNTIQLDHIKNGGKRLSVFSYGVKWGLNDTISGSNSTSWGYYTHASGTRSTVWGDGSIASQSNATAWGWDSKALSNQATAWGKLSRAEGIESTAWGNFTHASGELSTAFGQSTYATGERATAWGNTASASGNDATAWGTSTDAIGIGSTTWGSNNTAQGLYTTSWGLNSESYGNFSTAFGNQAETYSFAEIAIGNYNYSPTGGDPNYWNLNDQLFSVGNGTGPKHNALTIMKDGRMGVNKNVPVYALDIESEGDDFIRFKSTGGSTNIRLDGVAGTNSLEWRSNGTFEASLGYSIENERVFCYQGTNVWYVWNSRFGIKNPTPSYDLHMQNNSAAKPTSSSWTVASDQRLKTDVHAFTDGLDILMQIKPVWFTYNGEANMPRETGVGTIAQELEKVAPYMVNDWTYEDEETKSKQEYKAVDYGAMDFVIINAIQELKAEMDQLKAENVELKKQVMELKSKQ